MTTRIRIQLLALGTVGAFQVGIFWPSQISLWVTATCLLTWATGCDRSTSAIVKSQCKMSKHGFVHSWQESLTQTYSPMWQAEQIYFELKCSWLCVLVVVIIVLHFLCWLLLSSEFYIQLRPGNGPLVLVLCSGSKNAQFVYETCCTLLKFSSENKVRVQIAYGAGREQELQVCGC